MLNIWLFPTLDLLFLPLSWFPKSVSLTVVSALTGVLMIWLYWLTSDQWRMAFQKRRIKQAQNKLLGGNYSWNVISDLIYGNLSLVRTAFMPAVVTVLLVLILIPWVGTRYGYYLPSVREPFEVTVRSGKKLELRSGESLRHVILNRGNHDQLYRVMGLRPGAHDLELKIPGDGMISLSVPVEDAKFPHWPDYGPRKWYHWFVVPSGRTLPSSLSIERVHIGLTPVFAGMGFWFMGTYLPGWLTYFFLFSFLVGIYFKFRYSIE